MEAKHDLLIIGAGLAGSILAWQLIQAGYKVHLVHNAKLRSASRVAAGLINPVTGQRLVLQPNIDLFLTSAHTLYHRLSEYFTRPFLFDKPMLRTLQTERERNAWQKRRQDSNYRPFISQGKHNNTIEQRHTGYLDTNALLDALHGEFQQQAIITDTNVNYAGIHIHSKSVSWKHMKASHLIFCEGWRGQLNPWFKYLPFQPAKGEILDFRTENPLPKHIINQGKWLLPLKNGHFRVGASYETTPPLNENPSKHAKEELIQALQHMPINQGGITLTQQQAGIRPNTLDKQPFLGFHPKDNQIGIFNGFGSKGSLLIPWYAERMVAHLSQNKELPSQANIQRYTCA